MHENYGTSTRPDGFQNFLSAHGHVDGAQKKLQLARTVELDERSKRVQLHLSILLVLVTDQVLPSRHIVANVLTLFHSDGLTRAHHDISRLQQGHGCGCDEEHGAR